MAREIDPITAYCEKMSTPPVPLLHELERETYLKTLAPQMMSGALQGNFLRLLCQLKQPQKILEIGTFTGYAALCLAMELPEGGEIHCIEANEELEHLIRKYFEKAGLQEKLHLYIGQVEKVLPTLKDTYDLVFLDAGKRDYALHFDLVIEKVHSGGLILADNVLWDGKVAQGNFDKDTSSIHAFNQKILDDERVESLILPIRDGIMVARVK